MSVQKSNIGISLWILILFPSMPLAYCHGLVWLTEFGAKQKGNQHFPLNSRVWFAEFEHFHFMGPPFFPLKIGKRIPPHRWFPIFYVGCCTRPKYP